MELDFLQFVLLNDSRWPRNRIGDYGQDAVLAGGLQNTIYGYAQFPTIGGGYPTRFIQTNRAGTIAGGYANQISPGAIDSTIGGGTGNIIGTNANAATIPGGVGIRPMATTVSRPVIEPKPTTPARSFGAILRARTSPPPPTISFSFVLRAASASVSRSQRENCTWAVRRMFPRSASLPRRSSSKTPPRTGARRFSPSRDPAAATRPIASNCNWKPTKTNAVPLSARPATTRSNFGRTTSRASPFRRTATSASARSIRPTSCTWPAVSRPRRL